VLTVALLVVGALVLSSCDWPMFGYAPDGSRSSPDYTINTANVANLKLKLKLTPATVSNGCRADQASSPAVAGGTVYAEFSLVSTSFLSCNAGGEVAAFNAATGATLWTETTGATGNCISCLPHMPAVINGIVYDSANDDYLHAFNATTGHPLWTVLTVGDASSPTVVNGIVYVGSADAKAHAFNATTGAIVWTASTAGYSAWASPTVVNNVVYFEANGTVDAFNATTGAVVWTWIGPDEYGSTTTSLAVVNGIVYFCARAMYAFNAGTGAVVWTANPNFSASYFLTSSGPAVANGIIYNAGIGPTGPLDAFNATTGARLWTAGTDSVDTPAVVNGIVYIGSDNGSASTLNAFNATTGQSLWTAPTGTINSSPLIADGVVYIGSRDGNVYAFGLP
jgi:outer membrane protein assembly factor BamB